MKYMLLIYFDELALSETEKQSEDGVRCVPHASQPWRNHEEIGDTDEDRTAERAPVAAADRRVRATVAAARKPSSEPETNLKE